LPTKWQKNTGREHWHGFKVRANNFLPPRIIIIVPVIYFLVLSISTYVQKPLNKRKNLHLTFSLLSAKKVSWGNAAETFPTSQSLNFPIA
jgi:hypothetical protein